MIDIYKHNDEWFQPVFSFDNWQVAILNYASEQALENLKKLDVHLKTDEVFILNKGTAALITANIQKKPYKYHVELMKSGRVYNVPKNVWHNIAMKIGSSVYIVENKNTHLGDFKFQELDTTEKKYMCSCVNKIWDKTV